MYYYIESAETERLNIRRFTEGDWRDLHEYLSQEEVVRYEPYDLHTEAEVRHHNAHRVAALCNPLNTASWRLMERLGMRREGHLIQNVFFKRDKDNQPIWADTYEYAILADEWLK